MSLNLIKKFRKEKKETELQQPSSTLLVEKFSLIEKEREELNKRQNFNNYRASNEAQEQIVFWKKADITQKRSLYLDISQNIPANICLNIENNGNLSKTAKSAIKNNIIQLITKISEISKKAQVYIKIDTTGSMYTGHVLISHYKQSVKKTELEFTKIFNDQQLNFKNVNDMLWFSFKRNIQTYQKPSQYLNEALS